MKVKYEKVSQELIKATKRDGLNREERILKPWFVWYRDERSVIR